MLLTTAKGLSASATAQLGQTVEMNVSADGSPPLSYAWFKNGAPISGASGPKLVISPVAKTDAGDYTAQVTNAAGSALSDKASLTVIPMQATLTANITNVNFPPAAIIQWRLNGRSIPGAGDATYTFDPATIDGSLSVTITFPRVTPPAPAIADPAK